MALVRTEHRRKTWLVPDVTASQPVMCLLLQVKQPNLTTCLSRFVMQMVGTTAT